MMAIEDSKPNGETQVQPVGNADEVHEYDRADEREHISDRQEEMRDRRDQGDEEA